MPFLLLAATRAFLFGERLRAWTARRARSVAPYGAAGLCCVSVYGGYFNGGPGIVLLALLSLWGRTNVHAMNGLKNDLPFALSAISVTAFSVAGLVVWPQAIVMMLAAIVGGYAGAPLARLVPRTVLRGLIALAGFGMSTMFFYRCCRPAVAAGLVARSRLAPPSARAFRSGSRCLRRTPRTRAAPAPRSAP